MHSIGSMCMRFCLTELFVDVNFAGCLNDLHFLDLSTFIWQELTPLSTQATIWPTARGGHGFAALGLSIYMFGGAADDGIVCVELCSFQVCILVKTHVKAGYSVDVPRSPSFDDLYRFNITTGHWESLTHQQRPREWPRPR